jgi:pimeloyl-ACP methyl ester carboxylesterase
MPRTHRHATGADGTRIAWTSRGSGTPAVVLTDGIGCAGFIWRRLAPALARKRRVLHWNYRGHGESDPPRDLERSTVEDCVSDLLAVLDDAGEERAVLAGHSMGVQVVLEAHRRAPERVAALLLVCGAPGRLLDTFHDTPVLRKALPWIRGAMERWPGPARTAFRALVSADVTMQYALAFEVNQALLHREDLVPYFRDLSCVDPGVWVRLLASASEHDTKPHLPEIRVPTLVVAGVRDGFTPMHLSVEMNEAIPGSELLVLPGGTHVAPLEQPALVEERVTAFLERHVPVSRPPGRARATAAPVDGAPAATRARKPRPSRKRAPVASRPRAKPARPRTPPRRGPR